MTGLRTETPPRAGRVARSLLAIGCAVLLRAAAGDAASAENRRPDPLCSLDSQHYRVELVKEGRCCPNPLELLVEDRATGETRWVVVETHLRKTGAMRLGGGDRLLLAGLLERSAKGLAVIDLAAGTLETEIHAFDYRLSPSRQRIVYASLPSADDRGPRIEVVDFAGPAAEGGRVVVLPSPQPVQLRSPFLWSEDESRIVFVEETEAELWLVTVDLPPGEESPRIARQPVAAPGMGRVTAVSLRWRDRDSVELSFVPGGQDTVVMAVQ